MFVLSRDSAYGAKRLCRAGDSVLVVSPSRPDSSPLDRCGYAWRRDAADLSGADHAACCYRETPPGADRCVWHARSEEERSTEALAAARVPAPVRDRTAPYGEILDGATATRLPGEDYARTALRGADLSEAPLRGVDLSGADLAAATLSGAYLKGATLSGADLAGADLSGAYLIETDLSGATLAGADLSGALVTEADLSGADLTEADLSRATVRAEVAGVTVRDTVVTDADLVDTEFPEGTISRPTDDAGGEQESGPEPDDSDPEPSPAEQPLTKRVGDWRARLTAGAAAGAVSIVVGYLLTLAVVVLAEDQDFLRDRLFAAAGWIYYGAQLTPLRVTDPADGPTGGAFDGVTQNIVTDSSGFLGTVAATLPAPVYHLIPIAVLVVAGAGLAKRADATGPAVGAATGLMLVAGTVIPAAIGAVALSVTVDVLTLGPPVVESLLRVGILFPAILGAIGGLSWVALVRLRPALRRG